MADTSPIGTVPDSPPAFVRVVMLLLALAACGLSVYLFIKSWPNMGRPLGCGPDSGCDEVLSSRWSTVVSVPVSLPAAVVYAVILGLIFAVGPHSLPPARRKAWQVLVALAVAAMGAGLWFFGVQYFMLDRSFCLYCSMTHLCGLTLGALVLSRAWRVAMAPAIVGLVLVVAFIGVQVGVEPSRTVARGDQTASDDTGAGGDRVIELLDGKLRVFPHEAPIIGNPEAKHILVMLFDYGCPHCIAAHGALSQLQKQHEDELALVLMPAPLVRNCEYPDPRRWRPQFRQSCKVARLALAVFKADRSQFDAYDHWLVSGGSWRPYHESRRRAQQMVDAKALEAALADPWIEKYIAQGHAAYDASGSGQVPVILSGRLERPIFGHSGSNQDLINQIKKELGLGASPASPPED
jgi:uncharacterized membrane protein/glutaredoxin